MKIKKKWIRVFGTVLSILLFVLALFILHHKLRNLHLSDIRNDIRQISWVSFFLAILITCLDYWVLTGYDTLALFYLKNPLKYRKIAFASFIGYAFSHNTTIVGGSTARYRVYSEMGLSVDTIARLILFTTVTFWLGFLSVGAVVFWLEPARLPAVFHVPFHSARLLGTVFGLGILGYFFLTILRRQPLKIREWELAIPAVRVSVGQIFISSLDWLLAAGVLYLLLPRIEELTYLKFIGFFLLAQTGGLLSSVPGGLGVFETIMLLFLSAYVPSSAVFGSLLLYRLVYYLLPFGFGTVMLLTYEFITGGAALRKWVAALEGWGSVLIPYLLAFGCLAAGSVLLFSGAVPAEHARLLWLRSILPLPAIEFSHFLGSIIGMALLILGRGLILRLDAAYYLSLILLALGILLSLLRGLNYEEALILSGILLAFLPCRKKFYRKSSLFTERFTTGWTIMIILILSCSVWVGLFAYRHIQYTNELWWHFALHANAPRFLRATTGSVILLFFFGLMKLLIPGRQKSPETVPQVSGEIEMILQSFPRTYANLVWLDDKYLLFNDKRNAFLMYADQGRSRITMGDPIGPAPEWKELIWTFRELCHLQSGWPVFYQVSEGNLKLYLELGMSFLKLGEEARVDLPGFHLEGGERKDLRYIDNRLKKESCQFSIIQPPDVPAVLEELKVVSDIWLREKNTKEKGFSLGRFKPDYLRRFPIAAVRRQEQIIAFANIWTTAGKEEVSIDLMRYLPSAPSGVMDFLFTELMLWSRQEGYNWFNLGMAPLSGMEDHVLAPLWSKAGAFMFRHGEHFYNFQGLRRYKEKFFPAWESKYLVCPGGFMLPMILTNVATLISGGLKGMIRR